MEINPLQNLYDDFVKIIEYVEIKYNNKAAIYETMDIMKSSAEYIAAVREEDDFYSHLKYSESMLNLVGINDVNLIYQYVNDRRLIPVEYHEALLKIKRKYIIDNYVEQNNYYRKLNGLPDVEDINFIYVDSLISQEYNIDKNIPIHDLSNIEISLLKTIGYIETLKNQYSSKKYLNYLGVDKINIIEARTALNFSMLRFPSTVKDEVITSFKYIYEQCREYFMTNLYIQEHTAIYSQYDNFMSLYVMIMTMQQVIMRSIKSVIDREFYDDRCVRMMFDSYSIPYIENLDSDTMKAIVHNLNILIRYKSTDKVFFNLMEIFGFERAKMYKYFIVKDQKFDDSGFPITATKMEGNEFGELEEKPDYDKMYDLYFQKVELNESNYYLAMQESANRVSYDSIVDIDPYWFKDDQDVIDELYNSEYNFRESKYLGVNITFRLSELLFNTVYLIRMIFDNKNSVNNILVRFPKILDADVPLFDGIVFVCAMLCKKNHLKGEILCSPSKVLYVLGFNFENDFNLIRDMITKDEYLDNQLAAYLKDMSTYTVESVNNLYSNIKELKDFISSKMSNSSNIYEYRAYEKLYKALFISKENSSMFTLDNNEPAPTYLEYLKFNNPQLYQLMVMANDDLLETYLNHAVSRLSMLIPKLDELNYMVDSTGTKTKALMQLIDFFKSYTTDVMNMNIVFIVDTKIDNMLKLIDHIHTMSKTIDIGNKEGMYLYDAINTLKITLYKSDKLALYEQLKILSNIELKDDMLLHDKINIKVKEIMKDSLNMYDYVNVQKVLEVSSRLLSFKDRMKILSKLVESSTISLYDVLAINKTLEMMTELKLHDDIKIEKILTNNSDIKLHDCMKVLSSSLLSSKLSFTDNYRIKSDLYTISYIKFMDTISHIITELHTNDKFQLNDTIVTLRQFYTNIDKFNIHDDLRNINSKANVSGDIKLYDVLTYTSSLTESSNLHFSDGIKIIR